MAIGLLATGAPSVAALPVVALSAASRHRRGQTTGVHQTAPPADEDLLSTVIK